MNTEDAIREARRRWGSSYASDRYWRDGDAAASRFMVTDCKQIYGLSGKSFEDAESERLIPVSESMPPVSQETFYLCRFADEPMSQTYRLHRWDIVSGWYLNSFSHLYTH